MKKYEVVSIVLLLSLFLAIPNTIKASEVNNPVDISPEQAIAQIDSVGVEEVTEFNNETGVRLVRAAAYKNKTFSYKRGGPAAWCKDFISFKYNGSTVKENNKWQESGYIFPNLIKKRGISNYQNGTGYKDYRGTKTYKIGLPSKLGDLAIGSTDRSDYYRLKSNGSAYKK
ncbi:lacticin RM [Listeria ivanovii]|uniref:lacticin RM n=1 Tax=Listeria ivanovii TaxID=1638 RepID=UPI000DA8EEA3|nr:lacticin RM [Listeria ivanovii]PZF90506.1 lacticin RM [Listeria ivanovii]PZF95892.1 lacticin RM [Listeria ivanovii]PZG06142.1 lacticin RM [Listeria ivanovii]PZG11075.1 lacticin RM [Listeria ivanovii]PZG28030.1 lacticin RM [Listeria ivanovii]